MKTEKERLNETPKTKDELIPQEAINPVSIRDAAPLITALRENSVHWAIQRLERLEEIGGRYGMRPPFEGLQVLRDAVQHRINECRKNGETASVENLIRHFRKYVVIR